MRKFFKFFAALAILALILPRVARAQNPAEMYIVTLASDEVEDGDYFAAGDRVEVLGTVEGDAYLAGGQIVVKGEVTGDVLAVGGQIDIEGTVGGNVRLLGGQINILGEIEKNASVAGGSVKFAQGSTLNGSLAAAAGDISISSQIAKDVNMVGGSMYLDGSVGRDIFAGVSLARLSSTATVAGDFVYVSEENAQIDQAAEIGGQVTKKDPASYGFEAPKEMDVQRGIRNFTNTARLISLLGFLLVALIFIQLMPQYTKMATAVVEKTFWKSLGVGFLALIVAPIGAIVAMITLIGFPVGIITLLVYFILLYVAKLFPIIYIGEFLAKKATLKSSVHVNLLIGLAIYALITLIPIVGGFFGFFISLSGLGAVLISCRSALK